MTGSTTSAAVTSVTVGHNRVARRLGFLAALLLGLSSQLVSAQSSGLANGSFETPSVGSGNLAYVYNPSGASWVFGGDAGIAANASDFTSSSANAPDGAQAAFIQRAGTASQALTLSAGSYNLSFKATQRGGPYNFGTQILQVLVDGSVVGSFQPPSAAYGQSPNYSFTVSAGSHTVQLAGIGSGGSDYTAFVDDVRVTPAAPPASSCTAVGNASFESPSVGSGNLAYSYNPAGATWVFAGESGISANASDFTSGTANAPDGTQVAFIERAGSFSQALTLAAGTYSVNFKSTQRGGPWNDGTQIVRVSIDGTALGSYQAPSGAYGTSPTYTFTVTAGAHTLQLAGVGSGGDYTAFVDAVCLSSSSGSGNLPSPPVSPTPVVNYEYDAQGNPTKTVQAPGTSGFSFSTTNTYDALNRQKDSTDARSGKTQFGYDGLDRTVQVTDPRNLVTQTPRNGLGDATSLVSPDTGTANHTYDAAGNLKTRTDSRGVLATYSYDALNRQTGIVYSQSGQTSLTYGWAYDQSGAGFSNGVGRLTSTTHPAGSTQYSYDAQGRVLSDTQRVNAASGANSALVSTTVGYGYDAAGNVTSITYPSGRVVGIAYAGGKPSAITLAKDGASTAAALMDGIQWEPFGGVTGWNWQMASGAQANSRVYDSSGRLVRYRLGTTVRDITYDAGDRITAYTHYDAGSGAATPALDQGFGYDELGRLTSVTTATANWSISYDANGNRTGVTLNSTTSTYTTEATSNRLSAISNPARGFGYDNAGNTTSDSTNYTSTYNLAGRLVTLTKAGTTTSYTLDGMGRRVRKFISAGTGAGAATTVIFVYDQQGQLLGEYDNTGAALREYVWLGSTPVAMFTPDPANQANPPLVYYIHTDHLDTPRAVVDKNNAIRWRWLAEPFGTTAPETNPTGLGTFTQNLRFPGQYADQESGLSYNFFRDYDASIGRYAQSDPIGLAGGINTFLYANAAPTMYADPAGLFTSSTHNEITTAAVAIAGSPCPNLPAAVAGADWYPGAQAPRNAPWHHMRDGTNPNATVDSARGEYDNFVDEQWKSCTCEGLARAMHAIQDSYARGHADFQPWSGGLPSMSHAHADAYPSQSERDGAVRASVELIRRHGKECKDRCPK